MTVTQEGVAALFIAPSNGANAVATTLLFRWTFVTGALRYVLTIGTTPGGADVVDTGEIAQTTYNVANMPPSRLLYARLRTKFDAHHRGRRPISSSRRSTTSTSVQVLGAQTPSPVFVPAGRRSTVRAPAHP